MVLALGFAAAQPAVAQGNSGSIFGVVPESTASIVVKSAASGAEVTVSPAGDGTFRVQLLPPGSYSVTVKRAGHADWVQTAQVRIGTGTQVNFATDDSVELGVFTVVGSALSPIDMSSVETTVNFSAAQLEQLPVARDLTSVALLAPGTIRGDSAFEEGNLASFGGASPAENVYYFNGFNITNFRDGLGFSSIPYEFFDEFQVKTSGYGAEFGRSTGGVVNATSRRGSNILVIGGNVYYEPDFLRENSPSSSYLADTNGDGIPDETVYVIDNTADQRDELRSNLYASGPLIKDRLFGYAMGEFRSVDETYADGGIDFDRTAETPFYALKLDGVIWPGHVAELTYFRNYDDRSTSGRAPESGVSLSSIDERGGDTTILRYTGQLTDWLYGSALWGYSDTEDNLYSDGVYAYDAQLGDYVGSSIESISDRNADSREAVRVEFGLNLRRHDVRLGYDNELLKVDNDDAIPGGAHVAVEGLNPDLPQRYVYATDYEYVQIDNYLATGAFETAATAFYIEDTWHINERLTAYLGLRNESFDNKNVEGKSFIKIDDQLAPRVGLAYDVIGDGRSKLFFNYGRYFLPVATNTNLRMAGGELYVRGLYAVDASDPYDANGLPNVTDPTPLGLYVYGDGELLSTASTVDASIDPQYQDEYVVGFQLQLARRWQAGLSYIHRDLISTLEDIAVDAGLQRYADENGYGDLGLGGFDYYVLTNPGSDVTIDFDMDGDGSAEAITLSERQLGYPPAERYYNAIEFSFERLFDGKWTLQGSYTWSQSYGNIEGYVRSDNGQSDAGLTTAFDQPGLTDGAYGFLPNDRRHKFKLFGAYALTPEVTLGANSSVQSGRPVNSFGNHPTDEFAQEYGSESFYTNGVLMPRGSAGTLPWVYNVDLSLRYQPLWLSGMTVGADVFNVFDFDTQTEVVEVAEVDYSDRLNPEYKQATAYQAPRSVRLSVKYEFGL